MLTEREPGTRVGGIYFPHPLVLIKLSVCVSLTAGFMGDIERGIGILSKQGKGTQNEATNEEDDLIHSLNWCRWKRAFVKEFIFPIP